MKRLCTIYVQISTDFYRKAMPVSKIILNLKFLACFFIIFVSYGKFDDSMGVRKRTD